ncbi:hypothetical protein [Streptomyces sp. NPDC050535]|uniref:hypothetical protein n=1 Tax=Streptomyces sp. NPDC050535 TaxID=3365626 RepID=UPI003790DB93
MYRAKETFWAPGNRHVVKGDLVAAHDVVVEGREELFEAVVIPQALEPSQATSTPQETEPPAPEPVPAAETGPSDADIQGYAGSSEPPPAAAAKKTAAKKTTTAARTPAGGDAK